MHSITSFNEVPPKSFAVIASSIVAVTSTSRADVFGRLLAVLIHSHTPMVAPHLVLVLPQVRLCLVRVLVHDRPERLLYIWEARQVVGNVSISGTICPSGEGMVRNVSVVLVAIFQSVNIQSYSLCKVHGCHIDHLKKRRLRQLKESLCQNLRRVANIWLRTLGLACSSLQCVHAFSKIFLQG